MAFFKKNKKVEENGDLLKTMEEKYRQKMKLKDEKDERIRKRDEAYKSREKEEKRIELKGKGFTNIRVPDDYLDNARKKK